MTTNILRILLVEDSRPQAVLFQEQLLSFAGPAMEVAWEERMEKALARLAVETFDAALLDLTLPDAQGLTSLDRIQGAAPQMPVIILTGIEDEELAVHAIRQGAQDYLVKGTVDGRAMLRAIRYAIDRKRGEEALRAAHAELDKRVQERTAELGQAVQQLQDEIARRMQTEQALQKRTAQLRQLASELMLTEQRERQRLAGVLHDHLQQFLAGARFHTSALMHVRSRNVRELATEVDDLLTQAIASSRSLTAELYPPALREGGFIPGLEWLCRSMKQKHGLTVALQVSGTIAAVKEEAAILLFESVRELLFNAVKHARVDQARVQVEQQDNMLEVVVSDQGAGFDPEHLTAAAAGAGGFGLFAIRERLELLGGDLEIAAAPGQGSRFTLRAPAAAAAAKETVAVPAAIIPAEHAGPADAGGKPGMAPAGPAGPRLRVLLADDHAVMRQGLARLLREAADMEIVGEAADGREAVALTRQLQPDVVVMDVNMPQLSGIEATAQIHQTFPAVRVIGLSMLDETETAAAMLRAGAVQYLTKSGSPEMLVAAIRACGR